MIFFLPDLVALKGNGKDRPRTTDHEGPEGWGGEGRRRDRGRGIALLFL